MVNTRTFLVTTILLILLASIFLVLLGVALVTGTYSEQTNKRTNNETLGVIVVPYFEPESSEWDAIYKSADLYPGTIRYVIINPCSGPCGERLSVDWQNIIYNLKNRNVKSLGYIYNNSQSMVNIDYYMKAPVPTDGIFFDNEGGTDDIAHFKQYADYVHSLGGIVYINPGFNYSHVTNYLTSGLANVANLYEFESAWSHLISINYGISPSSVSVILGNVSTKAEMKTKLIEAASKGIGTIYIYEKSYDSLPTYFTEMIGMAAVTVVSKPNPPTDELNEC